MGDSDSTVDPLHVLFVDADGRLAEVATPLEEHPDPVETISADTVAEAVTIVGQRRVDCVVLLDAPETEDLPAVDGIETLSTLRESLPDVPVAIHSVLGEHETFRQAHRAGVDVVSASSADTELVYRQLRRTAGMERHEKSDRENLESLMEHYPHQLYLKDGAGRFEIVSSGTAEEYDLDRADMVSLSDLDVLDAYGDETHRREQELLETGERIVEDIDHWVDRTGRNRWVAVTKVPRYDAEGTPVGIVGSSREVTREKRKEQMVRELHTVGRELVRAHTKPDIGRTVAAVADDIPVFSHIQVVLADDDGTLDPVDAGGGETLFDRHADQFRAVVGDGTSQYVTADGDAVDDPSATDDFETAVLPLGSHGALGVAADDGTFTDFGIDLTNILAANIEAALDRTERERELERQNERLEEFASIVSHDLRNPLNVASGAAELLAADLDSPNVDRVRDALGRMDRLIEALLTLARKGQVVGDAELVDVGTTADDAWRVVDAPAASLTVADSGVVAADRDRLVELFENLFRNAVEHGGENVAVEVGISHDRGGFYVADDGAGIDSDAEDRLFEMGYSGADGTGYGLYIVSTIVDAHGWTITAGASDSGGARFDISDVVVEPN